MPRADRIDYLGERERLTEALSGRMDGRLGRGGLPPDRPPPLLRRVCERVNVPKQDERQTVLRREVRSHVAQRSTAVHGQNDACVSIPGTNSVCS